MATDLHEHLQRLGEDRIFHLHNLPAGIRKLGNPLPASRRGTTFEAEEQREHGGIGTARLQVYAVRETSSLISRGQPGVRRVLPHGLRRP